MAASWARMAYVESGMGIENVINRFFGHVNGRTSGAIQSVRVLETPAY
jgi:hypothetical protein